MLHCASLTDRGHEILDETPVQLPVNFRRPEPLHVRIQRMILEEIAKNHEGFESFKDAEDFDVEEDGEIEDMSSPYEQDFDHISESLKQEVAAEQAAKAAESAPEEQKSAETPKEE